MSQGSLENFLKKMLAAPSFVDFRSVALDYFATIITYVLVFISFIRSQNIFSLNDGKYFGLNLNCLELLFCKMQVVQGIFLRISFVCKQVFQKGV